MVSLLVVFYIFVILFSIIGVIRGWAQELLVTFSVILAFFLINVLEEFILKNYAPEVFMDKPLRQFWMRTSIIVVLVFFGYQTPRISRFASAVRKDKISDSFLGFFLGGINGYLVAGTLWYYLAAAGYPSEYFIDPATLLNIQQLSEDAQAAVEFLTKLPPAWLGTAPGIYIAVGLAFLFVMVVFI
jgi:uncharacterized membrane protein required for colicin V production